MKFPKYYITHVIFLYLFSGSVCLALLKYRDVTQLYIDGPLTTKTAYFSHMRSEGRRSAIYLFYKVDNVMLKCNIVRCDYKNEKFDTKRVVEIKLDQKSRVSAMKIYGEVRFDEQTIYKNRWRLYARIIILISISPLWLASFLHFYKKYRDHLL